MKILVIVILCGLILIPLASWAMYGYSWELSAWFGLLGVLGLVVVIVNRIKGTKPF